MAAAWWAASSTRATRTGTQPQLLSPPTAMPTSTMGVAWWAAFSTRATRTRTQPPPPPPPTRRAARAVSWGVSWAAAVRTRTPPTAPARPACCIRVVSLMPMASRPATCATAVWRPASALTATCRAATSRMAAWEAWVPLAWAPPVPSRAGTQPGPSRAASTRPAGSRAASAPARRRALPRASAQVPWQAPRAYGRCMSAPTRT
mmetsp:Transcript_8557/g.25620  ORF Transcript_8557/g.25620 Transcript_8557/m.25620 type:complete len:204 (+) Transcript_8557:389-1000(+)